MFRVDSEVGTLRRVLLHRPGLELNYLVAERVEEVIPMLDAAARRIGIQADETLIETRF